MASEADPGEAFVPVMIDDAELHLVPTLGACMAISALAGGLNAAVQRCAALEFLTIQQVLAAGLALNPVQTQKLAESIYRTGLVNLFGPCIEFINVVAHGGRRPPEVEEPEPDPPKPA